MPVFIPCHCYTNENQYEYQDVYSTVLCFDYRMAFVKLWLNIYCKHLKLNMSIHFVDCLSVTSYGKCLCCNIPNDYHQNLGIAPPFLFIVNVSSDSICMTIFRKTHGNMTVTHWMCPLLGGQM